jgi:hypothetical protein
MRNATKTQKHETSNAEALGSVGHDATAEVVASIISANCQAAEAKVSGDVQTLIVNNGGEMKGFDLRLKSADSIARKLELEAAINNYSVKDAGMNRINDALRFTAVLTTENFTAAGRERLQSLQSRVDSPRRRHGGKGPGTARELQCENDPGDQLLSRPWPVECAERQRADQLRASARNPRRGLN